MAASKSPSWCRHTVIAPTTHGHPSHPLVGSMRSPDPALPPSRRAKHQVPTLWCFDTSLRTYVRRRRLRASTRCVNPTRLSWQTVMSSKDTLVGVPLTLLVSSQSSQLVDHSPSHRQVCRQTAGSGRRLGYTRGWKASS